jgi:hypothetical protein
MKSSLFDGPAVAGMGKSFAGKKLKNDRRKGRRLAARGVKHS